MLNKTFHFQHSKTDTKKCLGLYIDEWCAVVTNFTNNYFAMLLRPTYLTNLADTTLLNYKQHYTCALYIYIYIYM